MARTHEYTVTGMTCGHCEAAVRREVGAVTGVETVQVSADTGALVLSGEVDDAAVVAAVAEAGYRAEPA